MWMLHQVQTFRLRSHLGLLECAASDFEPSIEDIRRRRRRYPDTPVAAYVNAAGGRRALTA